ncbi:uncharacterized protein LOC106417265 [Brassica napus]|uniref:uncharacterized protein LOC106417265 n=1 Tax=Brassica napus TaxID=3708 RepID=UPI000BBF2557|nr:uncharacterized protein LOC106417265 [Brassica napus]
MVGSKAREIGNGGGTVEEVLVSNRFGSLEEEGDKEELGDDVGRVDKNKENENTMNLNSEVLSRVHGKAIMFGATKEAKSFAGTEKQGNQPITRGEIELSVNGKRLRIERESVGRPGGAFAGDGEFDENEKHLDQASERRNNQAQLALPEIPHLDEVEACRGRLGEELKGMEFRRSIRYLVKKFSTNILAVFETHAGGAAAGRICQGLGFENSFRVDACGKSGGLWLLWRSEIGELEVVKSSDQFIYARVGNETEAINLIVVYAAPTPIHRRGLWAELGEVIHNAVGPVFIGGDFNTIVRLDERSGGNGRLSEDSLAFGDWINDLSLIDMGFSGNQFTWKRGKTESTFVAKRLDRILCCPQARLKWQEARVSHLPFLASDHAPLYLQITPETQGNACRRPFRFEAAWLKHSEFQDMLTASWDREIGTREPLERLGVKLRKWNKEVFGSVQKRKEMLVVEIKEIQTRIEQSQTDELLVKEGELLKEFEIVLEQ